MFSQKCKEKKEKENFKRKSKKITKEYNKMTFMY